MLRYTSVSKILSLSGANYNCFRSFAVFMSVFLSMLGVILVGGFNLMVNSRYIAK